MKKIKSLVLTLSSLGLFSVNPLFAGDALAQSNHIQYAQSAKPIKKGAHCACAKELFGIQLINGRCSWPNNLAEQINACAAKK